MKRYDKVKVAALAGGVGGAKLVDGLAQVLPPENLTVIVNTGDDFEHLGLYICPDLDTVCYTLAGLANPATGWGRSDESWKALESLAALGGPTWFRLGDRDLGLNLERTRRLRLGQTLSQITRHICHSFGVQVNVLPMSDSPIPTFVTTDDGRLAFQDYFVRRQCHPTVRGFEFLGAEQASPSPGLINALEMADLVIFCPSNPWVSIDPILAVPGIQEAIQWRTVLAVSPIISGGTIKGPAAKMFSELGIEPGAAAVAQHYMGLLAGFVLDSVDDKQSQSIQKVVRNILVTNTIMQTQKDRMNLAEEIIRFGVAMLQQDQR